MTLDPLRPPFLALLSAQFDIATTALADGDSIGLLGDGAATAGRRA